MVLSVPPWVAGGWQYPLQTETVTLSPKVADGAAPGTPVSVASSKRREEMRLSDSSVSVPQMRWHLWAANLAGSVPKRGDVITDPAGVAWVIRDVAVASLGQRYACSCRRV